MLALTRAVSPTLARCELSHRQREPIDVARAAEQHAAYEAVLTRLGCRVQRVTPAPDHPDAVFIEDTVVVTPEVAVIARPGAPSRRGEVAAVAEVLEGLRPLRRIEAPGTLDGGDVLRVGRSVWVGRSGRSNAAGIDQLAAILEPLGYTVRGVPVTGCLHLKSAVTSLADDVLVLNPAWVDRASFEGFAIVEVDRTEPGAGNVLRVGDAVVMSASHPRTAARVERHGYPVHAVRVDELEKAEAGVTCCSVLVDA